MRKAIIVLIGFLVFVFLGLSCKAEIKNNNNLIIASWNVQNLFDATDDGTEEGYAQFTSKGLWTEELYKQRLSKSVQVLSTGKLKKANVIILNEVENENVVKDLVSSREMKSRGFNYFAFAKRPGDAIGTAVISTIEISRAVIHETLYRPILQVDINYEQSPISVLAIHAKSRIEGKEETAHLRLDTAQTLSDISEEILNENPTVLVIAAGDFNDTYEDKNMMSSESGNSPLRVSSKKTHGNHWYCFWMDSERNIFPPGSYYWSKTSGWESFDNILIKNISSGLEISKSGVLFEGILKTVDGKPNAFNRNLMTGVSDHLPVWISVF